MVSKTLVIRGVLARQWVRWRLAKFWTTYYMSVIVGSTRYNDVIPFFTAEEEKRGREKEREVYRSAAFFADGYRRF